VNKESNLKATTVYYVYRNGRKMMSKAFKNGFASYEAARNQARIWLRATQGSRLFNSSGISINRVLA